MESKAQAALNRLKEIDKKYKHKKISSESSNSSDEGKVLRPTLNIKLPNPYEEYIESNSDESEHVAVRVVDDTLKARSRQSSDDNSEDAVKLVKEGDAKNVEDSSSREEISEIIEDVSETIQESFNGHFSLDDGVIGPEDAGKNDSDEILTDKYSESFESIGSDATESRSVKVKKSTSVSESVETKSSSLNNSRSNKSLESIASGKVSEKVLSEVEIEKKLSSESIKLSDIVEDKDENKLSSLELIENNFRNESKKTEEKSSSSKYEISNTKRSSHNSSVEKSKKISETIQTISDNKFRVPTTESDDYISESTKISSYKSIVKKNKKSSDSRQSVSDHEFIIMSKSENNDSSSEYIKSSSHKSIVKKSRKKTDVRQTVSDHEGYSSSKKKYPKNIPSSCQNLEKKLIQSHHHFKQEQQRLNSAMINYIQKMEEEHQRLLTWPKNLICPSRVNVKTVKPLELPHISGFVRPDSKVNQDEDINMEILRNRLLDIRQWIKDQYLIYKEHYDLAESLNKTCTY
ncbi:GSCOCG00008806001-RA-CDS [Cotesia congregata]|nr:GSCOCG00008806001-RA-CDS [Cotesia congregata]